MRNCLTADGGESSRLDAGIHRYPFTFSLPPTVPSSFEGQWGSVRYTAEATMERPWKFDHSTRSAFTVISLVDLNLEPPEFKVMNPLCRMCIILPSATDTTAIRDVGNIPQNTPV